MSKLDAKINLILEKAKISSTDATYYVNESEYKDVLKGVLVDVVGMKQVTEKIKAYSTAQREIAFVELVYPFLYYGKRVIMDKTNFLYLSEKAVQDLDYLLLEKLSKLSSQTFFYEFTGAYGVYKYESALDTVLESTKNNSGEDADSVKYKSFINNMLEKYLIDFFIKYPVLAMLMASLTMQWINYVIKFIVALNKDFKEIRTVFYSGSDTGKVSSLWIAENDRLSIEDLVLGITFENNVKLIYKARNIETDRAFHNFLEWINLSFEELPLKTIKIIAYENYGWVEFVPQKKCLKEQEVKNFYMRAGMILGILYVFGSCDMHCENLIANGENPVMIDMEALIGIQKDSDVLHNCFLPVDLNTTDESLICCNALGAEMYTRSINKVQMWENVNTDEMELIKRYQDKKPNSVVFLNNKKMFSYHYVEQLLTGFDCVYQFIRDNKLEVYERIQSVFARSSVRYFPRDNRSYFIAIHSSLLPKYLKSSEDRLAIIHKILKRSIVQEKIVIDDFNKYELELIYYNVVPRFNVDVMRGTCKELQDISLAASLHEAPVLNVRNRINKHSKRDYETQRILITKAFDTYREYVATHEMEIINV